MPGPCTASQAKAPLMLNAFSMNCVGLLKHGLRTHPRDRLDLFNTLAYWQDLARDSEHGLFDGAVIPAW
ncbi:hypothetical protein E8K88_12780 [Lampropedia aestuarii]|uniref:Uncharacterized protein n=1 Tax=Lampropedia aestuarii TaxID=2562762 RepID=A0A4S5BM53_9BURK|nr:hypothetical protein E8K88_12780 [Lampropedia aestuarii]